MLLTPAQEATDCVALTVEVVDSLAATNENHTIYLSHLKRKTIYMHHLDFMTIIPPRNLTSPPPPIKCNVDRRM